MQKDKRDLGVRSHLVSIPMPNEAEISLVRYSTFLDH